MPLGWRPTTPQPDLVDLDRAETLLQNERGRLVQWRNELLAEHADMDREGAGELSTIDQHLADTASDTTERDRVMSLLTTVNDALLDVDDALRRVAHDHYGRCAICGAAIPDERLEAVPATKFCKDHQGYWEGARLLLRPPEAPVPDDAGVEIEALMMYRWGGRASALPDDDLIAEPGVPGVPLEELDTEAALQEERRHGE